MMTFAVNHLSVFPAWMQQPMLVLIGLVVMASLLACLIKIVQTAAMRIFFVSLHRASIRLSAYLADQMKDPIPRPKTERVARYLNVAIAYLMSGMLVIVAVSFTLGWAVLHSQISLLKTVVLFMYVFLCWYMAAVLKAQAGRDRLNLKSSPQSPPARPGKPAAPRHFAPRYHCRGGWRSSAQNRPTASIQLPQTPTLDGRLNAGPSEFEHGTGKRRSRRKRGPQRRSSRRPIRLEYLAGALIP